MPLVVLNSSNWASYYDIAKAINYSADKGVRVVNISGFYDTPGSAYGVFVSGEYAYVADGECGIGIHDFVRNLLYADSGGQFGGNPVCYSSIQEAILDADSSGVIKAVQGNYDEHCRLASPKKIKIEAGYDSTFAHQSSFSQIHSISIENGTIIVENLIIGP